MKNEIKKAGVVTGGAFLFTAACISIGGIVSEQDRTFGQRWQLSHGGHVRRCRNRI